jgi:hypothetical protein
MTQSLPDLVRLHEKAMLSGDPDVQRRATEAVLAEAERVLLAAMTPPDGPRGRQ